MEPQTTPTPEQTPQNQTVPVPTVEPALVAAPVAQPIVPQPAPKSKKKLFVVLAVVIFLVIGGVAAYFLTKNNDKTTNGATSTETEAQQSSNNITQKTAETEQKTLFDDPNAKFYSFVLPPGWKTAREGDVAKDDMFNDTITSPSGAFIEVGLTYNYGRGGACEPKETDKPHSPTNTCATYEALKVEKLATKNYTQAQDSKPVKESPLYLVQFHLSLSGGSNASAAKSIYRACIIQTDFEEHLKPNQPIMGVFFSNPDFQVADKSGKFLYDAIVCSQEGTDAAFLNKASTKELLAVMKTFQVVFP